MFPAVSVVGAEMASGTIVLLTTPSVTRFPGAFAQYMKLPRLVLEEGPVTPFDASLSFDEAALAEPLACAINGLETRQHVSRKNRRYHRIGAHRMYDD